MRTSTLFRFVTSLHALPQAAMTVPVAGLLADKAKKRARVAASVEHASKTLGFLHANLVHIGDNYFLFAGPSGVGKTTYAMALGATSADILANDWVAVEYDRGTLYASDLNDTTSMRHTARCPIAGVLFLTPGDGMARDAFVPNAAEYAGLLTEAFDDPAITPAALKTLHAFWLHQHAILPFIAAVPARRHPQPYTVETIRQVLAKASIQPSTISVGVIGTGALGSELAYQLGQLPFVSRVYLYNRDTQKAKGYALDMNQALPNGENGRIFAAVSSAEAVFAQSSMVFLAFRDEAATLLGSLPERWQRLPAHLKIVRGYAQMAAAAHFEGTLYVVTNPVDILAYAFHAASQQQAGGLRTYQVYGIGLEVDMARTLHFARRLGYPLAQDDLTIFGNHSDELIITTPLSTASQAQLLQAVQDASAEIRAYGPRTVYGPVASAIRTMRATAEDGTTYATVLQEGAHIGRKITFSHGLPMLADTPPAAPYANLLRKNTAAIADHSNLLYNA